MIVNCTKSNAHIDTNILAEIDLNCERNRCIEMCFFNNKDNIYIIGKYVYNNKNIISSYHIENLSKFADDIFQVIKNKSSFCNCDTIKSAEIYIMNDILTKIKASK